MIMGKYMKTVIGYVYDQPQGRYKNKYHFEYTADKIARFIMQNNNHQVTITDTSDNLICNSFPGGFLNIAADAKFLDEELLPAIKRIQWGHRYIPIVFKEIEERVMYEVGCNSEKY